MSLTIIIETAIQNTYPTPSKPRKVKQQLYDSLLKITEKIGEKPPKQYLFKKQWICSQNCVSKILGLIKFIPDVLIKQGKKVLSYKRTPFLEFMLNIPILKSNGELSWDNPNKKINGGTLKKWQFSYYSNTIRLNGREFADFADAEYKLGLFIISIRKLISQIDISQEFTDITKTENIKDIPDLS